MAQLVAFHYQPRHTPLHRIDPRVKLPLFLLVVAVILHSGPIGLALLTVAFLLGIASTRLPVHRLFEELKLFALLLLLMFIARSVASEPGPVISAGPITLAKSAVAAGGLLVWRLGLLLLYGTLLAATTRSSHLQAAVAWYLSPFPFLPRARIATMVGLTISLIPLIFDSYNEISDAQRARCVQGIRNPVRRLAQLSIPLILKTFGRADTLSSAIESRCYNDERSFDSLKARITDLFWVLGGLLLAIAALLADRIL